MSDPKNTAKARFDAGQATRKVLEDGARGKAYYAAYLTQTYYALSHLLMIEARESAGLAAEFQDILEAGINPDDFSCDIFEEIKKLAREYYPEDAQAAQDFEADAEGADDEFTEQGLLSRHDLPTEDIDINWIGCVPDTLFQAFGLYEDGHFMSTNPDAETPYIFELDNQEFTLKMLEDQSTIAEYFQDTFRPIMQAMHEELCTRLNVDPSLPFHVFSELIKQAKENGEDITGSLRSTRTLSWFDVHIHGAISTATTYTMTAERGFAEAEGAAPVAH